MERQLVRLIAEFSDDTHGRNDYDQENVFVKGEGDLEFAPLQFIKKNLPEIENEGDLVSKGLVVDAHDVLADGHFKRWYEIQFGRKFSRKRAREVLIVHRPNNKSIFDALEQINKSYDILRHEKILMNSKNLPIQLGEWYSKTIFGMRQLRTSSQRGFDFFIDDKIVEVTVDWGNASSPKGTKIKKSLVELSDYCVMIFVAENFMIREICFLDSDFVLRKFSGKGHTLFLKDSDIAPYFFSNSGRHLNKVKNKSALMRYSSPMLAMKLAED
ncbi:MAG: hypothetical protein KAG61_06900 [Bacteriovoracaceae bacterium]|nr:hypothetical protein [Bacteriovoracaceae bacterium]